MFRKEDAAVSDWSEETVAMCAARQKEILNSAAQMLKAGGTLVYSTCTFSPEENEGTISDFLHNHPDFSVERVDMPCFDRGRPEWLQAPAEGLEHCVRLWPHKLRGEGHFAALLRREEGSASEPRPMQKPERLPPEAAEFLQKNGIALRGCPVIFGETVYMAPEELPSIAGLRVLRVGLELGELRKGRFLPAHALALWLKDFPQKADFPVLSPEIDAYLHGQTLFGAQKDWTLICADGLSLGWAKGADGILKNHYPKGLRRL